MNDDPAYNFEAERLSELCQQYIDAFSREDQFNIQLLIGMIVAQCASIYNLSPPAGILHPSELFRKE